MMSFSKYKVHLATVFGVFVIVGAAILYLSLFGVPQKQAALIENKTADWETYRSEEYGIEFKHPSGWYVWNGGEDSGIYIYEREVGPGLLGVKRLMKMYRHTNVTADIKTYKDAKTYAEQNEPDYEDSDGYFAVIEKDSNSVIVNQIRSYQTYAKITRGGPQECYEPPCDWSAYENVENLTVSTYIPHMSEIFSVQVEMSGEASDDEQKKKVSLTEETDYLSTYKQILATFKFLY